MAEPPVHMTPDEFRRLGHAMVERIAQYAESVEGCPILPAVRPGEVAASMPETPPEQGEAWSEILADIDRIVMPGLTHWQHPRFFAYFPANGSFPAVLGDLLATGLAQQGMIWQTSPACTEVETRVLDWLGAAIGLPDAFLSEASEGSGGGVIHGTASEATLAAMVAARFRLGEGSPEPVVYTSTQAHSSVVKNARIAGIGREGVRLIDVDNELRMKPDALRRAMAEDKAAGRTPCFVVATVGTTSTAAVDPIAEIGEVSRESGVWLHVDAAYAGAALICPEHRWMIEGIEAVDSFNFNPHKWLLTNFDCSTFWTRDRAALINAMSITPEYLRNSATDSGGVIDYRDWHVPLGRRFRALKLWFVMRHYGIEGLRQHIRHHVALAEAFEQMVRSDERFEVVAPRHLSLVCFRMRADDRANTRLMEALNTSGQVYLTHTRVPVLGEEKTVLRMAIGGTQTDRAAVDAAWQQIQTAAGAILEKT